MLVKQRLRTNIRMVVTIAVAISLLVSPYSFAQANTAKDTVTNTANTLKISPVRTDITIAPGASKTVKVTISNITKSPITVTPIENDFIAGDERGTPALILEPDKFAPTHSLKRFMKPLPNQTIKGGEGKTVNVVITVPKDAQPGGYFGALRFAPTNPGGGGQVNLSASVASLILLTVPGPTTERVNLTDFSIQQNGKSDVYFQSANDLQATLRLQNTGNIQEGPFGKISVKQGDKVIYEADFNNKPLRDMILPDSARRWDVPLKNIGSFGNYTVVATLTYGSKNYTIQVSKSFWVIPLAVILATVGAVILLILLIVGIWLGLRTYKRRILRNQSRRRR